jgi:hypothetical protein
MRPGDRSLGVGEDRRQVLRGREHGGAELHDRRGDLLDGLAHGDSVAVGKGDDRVVTVAFGEDDEVRVHPELVAAQSMEADHEEFLLS